MADREEEKKMSKLKRRFSKKPASPGPASPGPDDLPPANLRSATLPTSTDLGAMALHQSHSEGLFSKLKRKLRINSKGKYDLKSSLLPSPVKPADVRRKSDDTQLRHKEQTLHVDVKTPAAQSVKTQRKTKSDKEEVILIRKDKRVSVLCKAENGGKPEVIFTNVEVSDDESSGLWEVLEEDPYATINSVKAPATSVVQAAPRQAEVECMYARINPDRTRPSPLLQNKDMNIQAKDFNSSVQARLRCRNDHDYETLDEVKRQTQVLSLCADPLVAGADPMSTPDLDPDYETLDEVKKKCATVYPVQTSSQDGGDQDSLHSARQSVHAEGSQSDGVSSPSALAPLAASIDSSLPHDQPPQEECIYDNPNVILRKQSCRMLPGSSSLQVRRSPVMSEAPVVKSPAEEELVEKLSSLLAPPLPLRNYQKDEIKGERMKAASTRHSWASQPARHLELMDSSFHRDLLRPSPSQSYHNIHNIQKMDGPDTTPADTRPHQTGHVTTSCRELTDSAHYATNTPAPSLVLGAQVPVPGVHMGTGAPGVHMGTGAPGVQLGTGAPGVQSNAGAVSILLDHVQETAPADLGEGVSGRLEGFSHKMAEHILEQAIEQRHTHPGRVAEAMERHTHPGGVAEAMERHTHPGGVAEAMEPHHIDSRRATQSVNNSFSGTRSPAECEDMTGQFGGTDSRLQNGYVEETTEVMRSNPDQTLQELYKSQGARPKVWLPAEHTKHTERIHTGKLDVLAESIRDRMEEDLPSNKPKECEDLHQSIPFKCEDLLQTSPSYDEDLCQSSPSYHDGMCSPSSPSYHDGMCSPSSPSYHDGMCSPSSPSYHDGMCSPSSPSYHDGMCSPSSPSYHDGLCSPSSPDSEELDDLRVQETVYVDSEEESHNVRKVVTRELCVTQVTKPVIYANPRLLENVISGPFKTETGVDGQYFVNGVFKWGRYYHHYLPDRQAVEAKLKGFFHYVRAMLMSRSELKVKDKLAREQQLEMDSLQAKIEKRLREVHDFPTFQGIRIHLLKTEALDNWEPEIPTPALTSSRSKERAAKEAVSVERVGGRQSWPEVELVEDLHFDENQASVCPAGCTHKPCLTLTKPADVLQDFIKLSMSQSITCSRCGPDQDSDSEDEMLTAETYAKTVCRSTSHGSPTKVNYINNAHFCRAFYGELAYLARLRRPRPLEKELIVPGPDSECGGCESHISWTNWCHMDALMKKLVPHISPRLDFQFLLKTYEEFKFFILKERSRNLEHKGCFTKGNVCCRFEELVFLKLIRDEVRYFAHVLSRSKVSEALFLEERDVAFTLLTLLKLLLRNIHKIKKSQTREPVAGILDKPASLLAAKRWIPFRHSSYERWISEKLEDPIWDEQNFHFDNYTNFRTTTNSYALKSWRSPQDFVQDPNVLVSCRTVFAHTDTRSIELAGMRANEEPKPLQEREDFLESMEQLQQQDWYWGPISYEQAALVLKDKEDGSFLVRDSSDQKYLLSISFKSLGEVHHTRIEHAKGLFSFWSQPESHGKARICEFIDKSIQNSRDGRFLYFLRPSARGTPPLPIRLLLPVSRNFRVATLKHLSRFVIRQTVRQDHLDYLPIPEKVKRYLKDKHYYVEIVDEDQWAFGGDYSKS
ncbi:uncharacterized protein LOC131956654 [Physella acuta]|uniref:uncharacterized protein LOC131956654 n=1 Tax=Physella acuta TaxID=109671 RepID=UPI0027DBEF05|nr:uncharacterized protein LOC131956654 [Physella acuta]